MNEINKQEMNELLNLKEQEIFALKEETNKKFSDSAEYKNLLEIKNLKEQEISELNAELEKMNQKLTLYEQKNAPSNGIL